MVSRFLIPLLFCALPTLAQQTTNGLNYATGGSNGKSYSGNSNGRSYTGGAPSVPGTPNVCNAGAFTSNPSANCSPSGGVVNGQPIVIYIETSATIATPTAPCATFSVLGTPAGGGAAYLGTATSTGSCAVTEAATGSSTALIIFVWAATSNTLATVDGTPGYGSGFCTSCSTTSTTTSNSGGLVLAIFAINSNNSLSSLSFTVDYNSTDSGSGGYIGAGHTVQGSAGAINMTATSSGAAYHNFTVALKHS